jgi:hypothetical protein
MNTDSSWFDARRPDPRKTAPSYPIVAQYELDDPAKRGPLGLGWRREKGERPKIKPHEVLVWRVGNKYIVDERQLQASHDTVVRASSVSVVSVRPGTEVEVSFRIDSEDASHFTVKVTFICSVVDPVVVVRHGQVKAADALLAYLRGYQDLFALGLEHSTRKINKVRAKMAVQVKSYMTLRPPKIPGIEITSATVQVETPDTLGKLREISDEQWIEREKRKGEALIDADWQEHILSKAGKVSESVRRDPTTALGVAYADGGMNGQELAEQVRQIDEDHQQRTDMERLAVTARKYDVKDRDARWAHEERQAKLEWKRVQDENQRDEERKDRRHQMTMNIELLKIFAERGVLDTYNADIEDLVRRIRGDNAGPEVGAGDQRAELTNGRLPESSQREGDNVK